MRTILFLTLCVTAFAQVNQPLLSLAVNGSGEAEAFQGAPLVIELSLVHARGLRTGAGFVPIGIAARDGGWPNALDLRITNQIGERQTWPLVLTTPAATPLNLDGSNTGELTWVIKPEDVAKIPPGAYQLVVWLDSAGAAVTTGWTGRIHSVPVTLQISAEPIPASQQQVLRRYDLLVQYYSSIGDWQQAMATVARSLQVQPGNFTALESKGDLLADAGDAAGASQAYSEAVVAFYRDHPTSPEPPREVLRKQGDLFARALGGGAAAGSSPQISTVVNAASMIPGISSGAWIAITGSNLSPTTRIWGTADFRGNKLPTAMDGVSVKVNGKSAVVYYISPVQINALAPSDGALGSVAVTVTTPLGSTEAVTAVLRTFAPSFFLFDAESRKYLAAVHADGVLLGKPRLYPGLTTLPAKPGERLLLYGTGFGPTSPDVPADEIFQGAAWLVDPGKLAIRIGGVTARVEFAGIVSAGLVQINVVVPDVPDGDQEVVAEIDGATTQPHVFITVQR